MNRTRSPLGIVARFAGCRPGATLFELILALALTGIVMFVISMAVDLHLRTLRNGREEIDEAEIARAVLHRIARDLQNVVRTETVDMSVLQQMAVATSTTTLNGNQTNQAGNQTNQAGNQTNQAGNQTNQAGNQTNQAGNQTNQAGNQTNQAGNQTNSASQTQTASSGTSQTAQATTQTPSSSAPGLYGNETGLQVDASRLPRVDEYDPTMVATEQGSVVKMASDVKTITYSLRSDSSATGGVSAAGTAGGSGLLRRELDRAVAGFTSSQSGQDTSSTDGELLAAEVSQLSFSYFDGQSWLTEWDSEQLGGLPMAIEIKIVIIAGAGADGQPSSATAGATDPNAVENTDHQYRLVVYLPMARPASTASTGQAGPSTTDPPTGGTP